jgi:hypothetical protein
MMSTAKPEPAMSRRPRVAFVLLPWLVTAAFILPRAQESAGTPPKAFITYADAAAILNAPGIQRPKELEGRSATDLESAWGTWVARHDADIRARVERGEEDSIVNFWLFGTSFTRRPPARRADIERLGGDASVPELLQDRLEDLIIGLGAPRTSERLSHVRRFFEARGVDPTTRAGKDAIRDRLVAVRERMLAEFAQTDRRLLEARRSGDKATELAIQASVFESRGLSADTSILPDFGLDRMLEVLKKGKVLASASVRRTAIVGPGLDFMNKADGQDFYPLQTLQPFALIDSLRRLDLAAPDLKLATFDLNGSVNDHIAQARQRANADVPYTIQIPLSRDEHWKPELMAYWRQSGRAIGDETTAAAQGASRVLVRAIRVRPEVVRSITPTDLDIVTEHLAALPEAERFDLIVATNVFVYYTPFEQAMAVANAGLMLRPGGLLLLNGAVPTAPPIKPSVGTFDVAYSDRQYDHLFSYQRE